MNRLTLKCTQCTYAFHGWKVLFCTRQQNLIMALPVLWTHMYGTHTNSAHMCGSVCENSHFVNETRRWKCVCVYVCVWVEFMMGFNSVWLDRSHNQNGLKCDFRGTIFPGHDKSFWGFDHSAKVDSFKRGGLTVDIKSVFWGRDLTGQSDSSDWVTFRTDFMEDLRRLVAPVHVVDFVQLTFSFRVCISLGWICT